MNILISGGTGFVGTRLTNKLLERGDKVTILTRDKTKVKGDALAVENLSEIPGSSKIDAIINLAGATISKKWCGAYKQKLLESRLNVTSDLVDFMQARKNKPEVFISASAVGFYGSWESEVLDEESSFKREFTHELCKKWEDEALKIKKSGVRVCITRLGVVLGQNGGALKEMLPAFKACVGGKLGSGEQYFSWVHIDDVVNAFLFLIDNNKQKGIFNLTSPHPVKNVVFTKNLGKVLRRPTFFSMPSLVVKTLFGEMGDALLLNGQRVLPRRLIEQGFDFEYPKLSSALNNIINKGNR